MLFESYNFLTLNESDIREEVISPLLRYLGYRSGTSANIIREQTLKYSKEFLGRKNRHKDPEIRGRADYICEVDNSVRWVIEAKAPQSDISLDDIEQAYTYANHPEVRAVYFCLVNGSNIKLFQTNRGPTERPLLDIDYEELEGSLSTLANVLGADAIRRDHPVVEVDTARPIGKGLRSIARVTNGFVNFESYDPKFRFLNEMMLTISDGSIERSDSGCLIAYLPLHTPFRSINELNTKLGVSNPELASPDQELSTDSSSPTRFSEVTYMRLPAGDTVFDPYSWTTVTLPMPVECRIDTIAEGILARQKFHGSFRLKYDFSGVGQVIDAKGTFELYLS